MLMVMMYMTCIDGDDDDLSGVGITVSQQHAHCAWWECGWEWVGGGGIGESQSSVPRITVCDGTKLTAQRLSA